MSLCVGGTADGYLDHDDDDDVVSRPSTRDLVIEHDDAKSETSVCETEIPLPLGSRLTDVIASRTPNSNRGCFDNVSKETFGRKL